MTGDLLKSALFHQLGFGGDGTRYEAALEEAGLSKPTRSRISERKREDVRHLLQARFFRVCHRGDCHQAARREAREAVPASEPRHCEVCGGSGNRRAVDEMVRACRTRRWTRLVVVGGSPKARQELRGLVGDRLELRLVDGTARRTRDQARGDEDWADRIVVWGGTQLDHKVSTLYRRKVTTATRRGVGELAVAIAESAARG
jgi:hypothetical protein